MPYSSTSYSYGSEQTLSTDSVEIAKSSTHTVDVVIRTQETGDSDDTLSAIAQGSATAVGTDTIAVGEVTATASIGDGPDRAHAEASFSATAIEGEGGLAFATADAFAEVSGDFDVMITTTSSESEIATSGEISLWSESQKVSETGIDIISVGAEGSVSDGSLDESSDLLPVLEDAPDYEADGCGCTAIAPEVEVDFSGNVALVEFVAEASGPDTFAEVTVSVLTVEDQLSTVDGIAIAAVSA